MGKKKKNRNSDTKKVRRIADYLSENLNNLGYHILRYDAPYSTYLKIDGGLCHSIRISNHKSKKTNLYYRYNIMITGVLDNDYVSRNSDGLIKYYAREESTSKIIMLIETNRRNRIKKYGRMNYYSYVLEHLENNENNKYGFWAKAKTAYLSNNNTIEYKNYICTKKVVHLINRLKHENVNTIL